MATLAPPEPPTELEAFDVALEDFLRAIRHARGRAAARAQDAPELSLSQFLLLDPLVRADAPLGLCDLAVQAGVAAPTATRMVDALERDGLVTRERPPGDRRAVHVRVTKRGWRQVRAKRARLLERRTEIFESLPPKVRRQAAPVLRHLAAAVEDLR
jgi:DNA-binding MarR family transcriptional regulator